MNKRPKRLCSECKEGRGCYIVGSECLCEECFEKRKEKGIKYAWRKVLERDKE